MFSHISIERLIAISQLGHGIFRLASSPNARNGSLLAAHRSFARPQTILERIGITSAIDAIRAPIVGKFSTPRQIQIRIDELLFGKIDDFIIEEFQTNAANEIDFVRCDRHIDDGDLDTAFFNAKQLATVDNAIQFEFAVFDSTGD